MITLCLLILILKIVTAFLPVSHKSYKTNSIKLYSSTSSTTSNLPNDFQDAVERCAKQTFACINSGITKCRIDFDTTVGDQTYTSIKNSLPMLKVLVTVLTNLMEFNKLENTENTDNLTQKLVDLSLNETQTSITNIINPVSKTIKVFFPDMGAAVLTRRDWKLGTINSEVPFNVVTANIQNDPLGLTDKLAIILCPLYSEAEFIQRIMTQCDEKKIPCLIINPELVNMDQGFGVSKFVTVF
jgi:hypothetical protein